MKRARHRREEAPPKPRPTPANERPQVPNVIPYIYASSLQIATSLKWE